MCKRKQVPASFVTLSSFDIGLGSFINGIGVFKKMDFSKTTLALASRYLILNEMLQFWASATYTQGIAFCCSSMDR